MALIRLKDLFPVPGSIAPQRRWHHDLLGSDNVVLDLSETGSGVTNTSSIRLDSLQLLLLANLMSGSKANCEFDVVLPTSPSILRTLARTPLLGAIANHRRVQQQLPLQAWMTIWNPHDRAQLGSMMAPGVESTGPSQRGLLTLTNPHHRSRTSLAREVRGVVDPWLNRRFMPDGNTLLQEGALRSVERVMSELTENIADHAFPFSVERSPQSISQIYTTRGGRDSMDRFVITVCDNGVGIPRSVRRTRSDLNGMRAFQAAVGGTLGHRADRQWGLLNVHKIVAENPGSRMVIVTSHLEDRQRSLIHVAAGDDLYWDEWRDMPVHGTLVYVQLALPIPNPDQPSLFDFDGLTFDQTNGLVSTH